MCAFSRYFLRLMLGPLAAFVPCFTKTSYFQIGLMATFRLQGIMVVVFVIVDHKYNRDSLQARLI